MTGLMSATALKFIACVCMLVDHLGVALFDGIPAFRMVGRLAFPLYCFLLTESFFHTTSRPRYAGRLAAFALLSEIPFDLLACRTLWSLQKQNVFFTLLLGLLAIWCLEAWKDRPFLSLPVAGLCALAAHLLRADYGWFGVLLIVALYACHSSRLLQSGMMALLCVGYALCNQSMISLCAAASALLLLGYNGRKGRGGCKYFFYAFYPCHLLVLVLLRALFAG